MFVSHATYLIELSRFRHARFICRKLCCIGVLQPMPILCIVNSHVGPVLYHHFEIDLPVEVRYVGELFFGLHFGTLANQSQILGLDTYQLSSRFIRSESNLLGEPVGIRSTLDLKTLSRVERDTRCHNQVSVCPYERLHVFI